MVLFAEEKIVEVRNVTRRFGNIDVVQDVTFTVNRQEIFALLGPNGAGKTTLANMLTGNQVPDVGSIHFYFENGQVGVPAGKHAGYFPGDSTLFRTLPIGRLLYHSACKRGMREDIARQSAEQWLKRIGLFHRANTPFAHLSRGNQQKIQFAEAVLHRPHLIFFDEPFSGLDPINQDLFIDLMREMRNEGMTIIVADHNMGLIERVAHRMLLIRNGHVIAGGTLDQLRTLAETGIRIRLRLADPRLQVDLSVFERHPSIRQAERTASGEIRLLTRTKVSQVEVLNFVKTQFRISEILSEPANLHDIYVQLISDDELEDEEEDDASSLPVLAGVR